jgi:hypothetical protein
VMNTVATNNRSWTMLENLSGTNYIYGNVFLGLNGASSANGLNINTSNTGVVFYICDNTFVCKNSASNNIMNLQGVGTAYIRNNIVHAVSQNIFPGNMTMVTDHNLWYGGFNAPACTGCLQGQDPLFTDYTNNDFSLKAASPAKGAGVNLGPPYDYGIAPGSAWPGPVLIARSAWDMGAYAYTTNPIQNSKVKSQNCPTTPLLPNPVKVNFLKQVLPIQRDLTVYDLAGNMMTMDTVKPQGLYIVQDNKSSVRQKIMVVE